MSREWFWSMQGTRISWSVRRFSPATLCLLQKDTVGPKRAWAGAKFNLAVFHSYISHNLPWTCKNDGTKDGPSEACLNDGAFIAHPAIILLEKRVLRCSKILWLHSKRSGHCAWGEISAWVFHWPIGTWSSLVGSIRSWTSEMSWIRGWCQTLRHANI